MTWHCLSAALVAACLLQACAVGPNYQRPDAPVPAAFRGQAEAQPESIADLPWWEVFQDAELQALIAEALRNNYDLATAVARVEQARGQLVVTRSAIFPQGGYAGEATRGRRFAAFTSKRTFDVFAGVFNMSWELDLWGRIRRATEAAKAELLATNDIRRGVVLSLVAQVASTYFALRELDVELEIAHHATATFDHTRQLFEVRFQGGAASKLPVARAEAALAQATADVPDTRRRIVATENALSILLGRPPAPIARGDSLTEQRLAPRPPAGVPAAILAQRPDVLRVEQQLRAANALVGVSIADFFPRIGLTAVYGGQSTELEDVVRPVGNIWQIAASAAGPLFQGGRLIGAYKASKANWEAAKAQYESTVLTALREVSDALVDADELEAVRAASVKAVEALEEASELATLRYTGGQASYFEVLEAQQQLFPAQRALARVQLAQLLAVVRLYAALGGGWSESEDPPLDAFPNWPS